MTVSNKKIGLESANADIASDRKYKVCLGDLYSGGGDSNEDGGVDDIGELDTKFWWLC